MFAAILHQLRREERQAQEYAEAAIVISSEHGLVLYHAMATTTRGWALIDRGREEEAIEEMRRGLAALQVTGAQLMRPHFLGLLSGALAKAGRADEGLRVLEDALATAQSTGERYYQAELHRLKGEQLLAQPARREAAGAAGRRAAEENESSAEAIAEDCFNESIRLARQQTSRSLELRAVTSLARLHQRQGKGNTALGLLTHTYRNFTEGFDTLDLRDAQALLDELS
jgi:predicted ATPase